MKGESAAGSRNLAVPIFEVIKTARFSRTQLKKSMI
jgi:hypothetical protein